MITQKAPGWEMRTTQRCEFVAQCLQLTCSISPQIAAPQRKWLWRCWTTCSIGRSRPCQTSLARANMARSSWTRSWSMAFAVSPPAMTLKPSSIDKCINFLPHASRFDIFLKVDLVVNIIPWQASLQNDPLITIKAVSSNHCLSHDYYMISA